MTSTSAEPAKYAFQPPQMLSDLVGKAQAAELADQTGYFIEQCKILGWREMRPWDEFFAVLKPPSSWTFKEIEQVCINSNLAHILLPFSLSNIFVSFHYITLFHLYYIYLAYGYKYSPLPYKLHFSLLHYLCFPTYSCPLSYRHFSFLLCIFILWKICS